MILIAELFNEDCLVGMSRIPDASVDMILCDLPYGTTQNKWDCVLPLDKLWASYNRIIKPNGAIALFSQTPFDKTLGMSNIRYLKYEWIWKKNKATGFLNSKKMPLKEHENILVFYKDLPTYNPQGLIKKESPTINKGSRGAKKEGAGGTNYGKATKDSIQEYENFPKDILEFGVVMKPIHPTEKPVPLLEYLIRTYTNQGETVLDNCMGSGSTAIAAINAHRNFIGFELESTYYEVAKNRINKHITDSNMQDLYTKTA